MPTWKKYAKADDAILKSLLTEQGDIIYASAASTPAALPHGTSSQYLKSGGNAANPSWDTPAGGGPTIVRKTADEIVNNSSVLQNDNHLLLAIAANEIWEVELTLLLQGIDTTDDFKFGWAYPGGCLIYWGALALATGTNWHLGIPGTQAYALSIQTGTLRVGSSAAAIAGGIVRAIVINGAAAGTLTFQWAQNTAMVGDTKILANSCLIAYKLG